jgi:hypothetical protein
MLKLFVGIYAKLCKKPFLGGKSVANLFVCKTSISPWCKVFDAYEEKHKLRSC